MGEGPERIGLGDDAGGIDKLRECFTGGADFLGEDLEDGEHVDGVVAHELKEVFSADEAEFRAWCGLSGEGVGLGADDGGEAEERALTGDGAHGGFFAGAHAEGDAAVQQDVNADGLVALVKEDAVGL